MKDVTSGVLLHALEVLCYIKTLTLRHCSNIPWSQVKRLENLRELRLLHCNINDEELTGVLAHDKLNSLQVNACLNLTSKSIKQIGQLKSLTKLDYFRSIGEESVGVLRELANLRNLTYLRITCDSNDVLMHLCQHLTQLQELVITKSQLKDAGLRCIGELSRLKKLVLHRCPGVTSSSLDFISLLPSLRCFSFDASLCFRGDGVEKMSCLNNIDTLREVEVRSNGENMADILKIVCRQKSWRLKYQPSEATTHNDHRSSFVLSR